MKRAIKSILFLVIIFALLNSTFFLAEARSIGFVDQATTLNRLGLFLGSDKGFELEREPTRVEAATMLVRLLGKEAEAKSNTYYHPFKDVPLWADIYVGYLYQAGLTKGTSNTTFSPQMKCTAQMYTVFVLRALGYTEENGSFSYSEARNFAVHIGLIDPTDNVSIFLRDNIVAMSYSALFQKTKDSAMILLEILISNNSVNKEAAQIEMGFYNCYLDYITACENSHLDISSEMDFRYSTEFWDYIHYPEYRYQHLHSRTVVDGDKIYMSNGITSPAAPLAPQNQHFYTYYADGWLYTQTGPYSEIHTKKKVTISKSDYLAQANPLHVTPYYLIDAIYKSSSGGKTSFFVSYNKFAYKAVFHDAISIYEDKIVIEDAKIGMGSFREDIIFGPDGKLIEQKIMGRFESDGQNGSTEQLFTTILIQVNQTGDSVTVLPFADLGSYIEVDN